MVETVNLEHTFIVDLNDLAKESKNHSKSLISIYNKLNNILSEIHKSDYAYSVKPFNELSNISIMKGSNLKQNYIAEIKECSIANGATAYIAHKSIPKFKAGLSKITDNNALYYSGLYTGHFSDVHKVTYADFSHIIKHDISLVKEMFK